MLELPGQDPEEWYRKKREAAGRPVPEPAQDPAATSAGEGPDDWYARKVRERVAVLRQNHEQGQKIDVDLAARVLRAQARTGASAELLGEILEDVEPAIARADFDAERFWKTSPAVARYMSRNPYYAALIKKPGDQAALANLEQLLRLPRDHWPMPDEEIRRRAEKFGTAKAQAYLKRPRMTRKEFDSLGLPPGFEETQEDFEARYPTPEALTKELIEEEYRTRKGEEGFVGGEGRATAFESLGRRATENPLFFWPGYGGIVDYARAGEALDALKAMADGTATEEQADFGERYVRLAAAADRRGTTFMSKAASIFAELPAFAGEMALTGPAYRTAKGSAELAFRGLLKRALEGRARGMVRGTIGTAAGLAAQSALMLPIRGGEDAARRQAPHAGIDAAGAVQVQPGTGDSPGLAWARAAIGTLIETGTERLGGSAAARWLDRKANKLLFESWAGKASGRTYEGFQKLLQAGGVNGVLGEIGEEEAGKILRSTGGLEEYKVTTLEELGAQALAFGVLPGGAALLGRTGPRQPPTTNPEAFRTTAKFVQAMELVEKAPDQAEALFREIAPSVVQYIPVDAFTDYYSKQTDPKTGALLEPRAVAAEILGDPGAYDRAIEQGTDLAVPFSRFAVTIGRDQAAAEYFAQEMRQDPLERNPREAAAELSRRQEEADAEDRLAKRALERLGQREQEIREEAKKVARDEARAALRQLEETDVIARVQAEVGRRLYWTGDQAGRNVEELVESGVPRDMIANPEEAARRGPAYATPIDEAADRLGMSDDELVAALTEAAAQRRDLEQRAVSGEATEETVGAVWEREFGRVLEEVTAEEAGGTEAARAAIARVVKQRLGVSGFGAGERESMAELEAAVFHSLGKRANVNLAKLHQEFGPRIRRATSPGAAGVEVELEQRRRAAKYSDPNQGSLFDAEGNPNPQAVGGALPEETPAAGPTAQPEAPQAAAQPEQAPEAEPAAPAPVAAPPAAAQGPLGDVGEQLWYNRRNFYGKGVTWDEIKDENATLKVLSVQKGKIWPRPDYEKLVDEGMPPLVAHIVKQVYDGLAVKPDIGRRSPTDEEMQLYLEEIARIRDAAFAWAKDIQGLEVDWEALAAKIAASPYGMGIMEAIAVQSPLDRVYPAPAGDPRGRFRNNPEANRRAYLIGGNRAVDGLNVDFRSLREAAKAVAEGWPAPKEAWEKRFEILKTEAGTKQLRDRKEVVLERDEYDVVERKRGYFGGHRMVATGFASREEAIEKARELAAPKKGGTFREANPGIDLKRTGPVQRPGGLDVGAKDLKDQFGFRGINYGNWVNDSERQSFTNQAYDSLSDLADLLGVPAKALSLRGLLGLAFGAQGKGGAAAAHFVPGVNEINLTKTSGAGSLAHEWAHALDHYFAVQAGESIAKRRDPFLTTSLDAAAREGKLRPEIVKAFRDIMSAMKERIETPEEVETRLAAAKEQAKKRLDRWIEYFRKGLEAAPAAAREEFDAIAKRLQAGELGEGYEQTGKSASTAVHQAVGEVRRLWKDALGNVPNPMDLQGLDNAAGYHRMVLRTQAEEKSHEPQKVSSSYLSEAEKADKGKGGETYFSTPWELFARAFQSYVMDKLATKAQRNDFLTRPQGSPETYRAGAGGDWYPRGVERGTINRAFDELVGALKTRETDEGVEFYQAAYHGSPHQFEEFDLSKIGSGEGAQVFGWGLYFAGNKEVAKFYRNKLSRSNLDLVDQATVNGVPLEAFRDKWNQEAAGKSQHEVEASSIAFAHLQEAALMVAQGMTSEVAIGRGISNLTDRIDEIEKRGLIFGLTPEEAQEMYPEMFRPGTPEHDDWRRKMVDGYRKTIALLKSIPQDGLRVPRSGRLFKVDIPEDSDYLSWDLTLPEQSPKVQKAIRGMSPKILKMVEEDLDRQDLDLEIATGEELYKVIRSIAEESPLPGVPDETLSGADLNTARDASLFLSKLGISGIRYLDQGSRGRGEGTHNYVVFDDKLIKVLEYEQAQRGQDPQGGYVPPELTQGRPLISFYKGANLSTYLHESGHLYLDLMARLAGTPGTAEGIRSDVQAIMDWFGVKDLEAWNAMSLEERRPFHEKFARGFEAYLMEGKAPSTRLAKAFERFKGWLVWIYKKVARLNVELTPEVRRVMDRLVATEQELVEARSEQARAPLPAETLSLSPEEEKRYQDLHVGAAQAAQQKADRAVLDGVRQTLEALLGEDRAAVREAVEREVAERPVYRAKAALEKGKGPDGKPLEGVEHVKLSRAAIADRFGGADRWKKIRRLTQAKGGISPEQAAEQFGFASAEELLRALETAESFDAVVARETDARLLEMKGAQEVEAAEIAEEAMKAIHTDERADLLAYELGRLASRLGRRHTPVHLVREHAEKTVGEALVRDVQPHVYQRGEARAAADALQAALKKDLDGVFDAKERELLNHELYRAAQARLEAVEKGLELVRQGQRKTFRQTLGRADFLERWEDLADRFEFFRITRSREEARKGLAEWIRDREASGDSLGEEIQIPEWVRDETFRTNYRDLTGQQFDELMDSFKQIAAMARYNNALAAVEKRETRDDARAHLIASLRENMKSRPPGARTEGDRSFLEKMQAWLRKGDASLLKAEQLFEWWDGGRLDGPWHEYLFKTASAAQTAELDYTAKITSRIAKAVNAMPKAIRKRMHEEIELPGLGRPVTRRTAIGIALNAGNVSNWRKMVRGENMKRDGLSEPQLRAAIDSLTPEEIAYVNSVWELLEDMWPDVSRLHKDLTGIEPPKVPTRPYRAKNGLLKGGYYPVIYESALSRQGEKQAQANFGGLVDEEYIQAKLVSGYRTAREEGFAAPVNLDLDVLPSHLAGVVKDLTHRKWLIDANWITSDPAILAAIKEYAGEEYTALVRDWVKRTVNDRSHASLKSLGVWKSFFEGLRFNTMIASMGFKAATMSSQLAGVGPAIEAVGLEKFGEGLGYVFKGPRRAYREMIELSGEMRHRLETKDRDIRQKLALLQGKDDLVSKIQDFSLRGIGYADLMVSMPTWWAGYFKGLEEYDGDKKLAAEAGDRAVRLSQGSGGAKDLSAVQSRQDTLMRLLTMYYTPFGALYARLRDIGHQYGKTRDGAAAAARMFWVWALASTLAELASGRGPDDDKDEAWLSWWLKNQALYPFMTVPGVRDVASAVGGEYGYQFSPIAQVLRGIPDTVNAAGRLVEGEIELDDFAKRALRAAGPLLGLPTTQLGISGEYLLDLVQGDVPHEDLGWFAKDLFFRRPKSRNTD